MSQQEIPQICEASKLSHQECTHYAVVPSGFSPHIVFFRWRCNFISISSIVNSSVPSTQCGSPILIGWIWHLLAHIHKSFCWFLFGPFLEPFCLWWADMKTCLSDWCGVGVVTARTSTLLRCEKKNPTSKWLVIFSPCEQLLSAYDPREFHPYKLFLSSQHHHGTGEFAAQSGACTVAQQSFQVLQRQISLQAEFVSHPNLTRSWKIVL